MNFTSIIQQDKPKLTIKCPKCEYICYHYGLVRKDKLYERICDPCKHYDEHCDERYMLNISREEFSNKHHSPQNENPK